MDIKGKIKKWQESHIEGMALDSDIDESNVELELVMFAIDNLTDNHLSSHRGGGGGVGFDGSGGYA